MGVSDMPKSTVVKLFVGSAFAFVAGIFLALVTLWFAYANGAFVMSGPDVTGIETTPFAWAMVGLFALALVPLIGGLIGGLVSWIGALLNTAQVDDKTWFIVLLVLGLLSFGIVAMIAYVIGGPDGTQSKESRTAAITAATSTVVMNPQN
jgi:hypothetical protein